MAVDRTAPQAGLSGKNKADTKSALNKLLALIPPSHIPFKHLGLTTWAFPLWFVSFHRRCVIHSYFIAARRPIPHAKSVDLLRKGVNEHSGVSYVILCHLTLVPAMSVLKYRLIILDMHTSY